AVSIQSRLVFYSLALVPVITILAMYQAFAVWPSGAKRWFTSLVVVSAPVLAAYAAAGLNNRSWSPTLTAMAALIAATYTAAIAAANLAKNSGHDLGDGSSPLAIQEAQLQSAGGSDTEARSADSSEAVPAHKPEST